MGAVTAADKRPQPLQRLPQSMSTTRKTILTVRAPFLACTAARHTSPPQRIVHAELSA